MGGMPSSRDDRGKASFGIWAAGATCRCCVMACWEVPATAAVPRQPSLLHETEPGICAPSRGAASESTWTVWCVHRRSRLLCATSLPSAPRSSTSSLTMWLSLTCPSAQRCGGLPYCQEPSVVLGGWVEELGAKFVRSHIAVLAVVSVVSRLSRLGLQVGKGGLELGLAGG